MSTASDPLSSVAIQIAPSHEVTVAELIDGWRQHLDRLIQESTLSETRDMWGAHDLFAALHLRDFAAGAVRDLKGDLEKVATERLRGPDKLLMDFTEPDSRHLVRQFGEEPTRPGWWWDRIPCTGLARAELEKWHEATV